MPNATVVYTNTVSGAVFETRTDRNGDYHFSQIALPVSSRPTSSSISLQLVVSNSVGASRNFYFRGDAPITTAKIYNILGRQAAEVVLNSVRVGNSWLSAGFWNGGSCADGVYFAAVKDGSQLRVVRFLHLQSGDAVNPMPLSPAIQSLFDADGNETRSHRGTLDDVDFRVEISAGPAGPQFEPRTFTRSLHDGDNGQFIDSVHWAIPHRVLMVGNSYTYVNGGVDAHLQNLAFSADSSVDFFCTSQAEGGYTLQDHWNNNTTRALIATGRWDMVILQEQSQRPVLEPDSTMIYARLLDSVITATGAQTAFYMTWAREYDPPMIEGLAFVYDSLGRELAAPVAPVGRAFQWVRTQDSTNSLYDSDGSHPNVRGTYLACCVFYGMLFRESPVGIAYVNDPEITDADRDFLQNAAWQSLQLYPPLENTLMRRELQP